MRIPRCCCGSGCDDEEFGKADSAADWRPRSVPVWQFLVLAPEQVEFESCHVLYCLLTVVSLSSCQCAGLSHKRALYSERVCSAFEQREFSVFLCSGKSKSAAEGLQTDMKC